MSSSQSETLAPQVVSHLVSQFNDLHHALKAEASRSLDDREGAAYDVAADAIWSVLTSPVPLTSTP